ARSEVPAHRERIAVPEQGQDVPERRVDVGGAAPHLDRAEGSGNPEVRHGLELPSGFGLLLGRGNRRRRQEEQQARNRHPVDPAHRPSYFGKRNWIWKRSSQSAAKSGFTALP